MKTKLTRGLCLLLALLMMAGTLAACANEADDPNDTQGSSGTEAVSEADTLDEAEEALKILGELDWGGREFTVLYNDSFKSENHAEASVSGEEGESSQIINDAVYERNVLFGERYNLKYTNIERDANAVSGMVTNEASAPTGDFQLVDTMLGTAATLTTNGVLYDLLDLGVDLEGPWWDTGTANFVLEGGVYFMSGSINTADDQLTYVLIFNKKMYATYSNTIANPYQTVRDWEWTLDYFNNVIQGISAENGDGKWDELDTYGFVTTWEYGNTFFLGSDLRYIINDATVDEPTLFLAEASNMEKALNVLELSQSIYHDNNASFMSPPGKEALGLAAFKENRGLFYAEVAAYLATLNEGMDAEFGILPVPKYDKQQEFYRTWTHGSGSTFAVTSAIPDKDKETVGDLLTALAIMSHQTLKPAYYDITLTSRNVHDAESAEMLDLIFANRVYDLAFYFASNFGFYELFKSAVNDNSDSFTSNYQRNAKRFANSLKGVLRKLQD